MRAADSVSRLRALRSACAGAAARKRGALGAAPALSHASSRRANELRALADGGRRRARRWLPRQQRRRHDSGTTRARSREAHQPVAREVCRYSSLTRAPPPNWLAACVRVACAPFRRVAAPPCPPRCTLPLARSRSAPRRRVRGALRAAQLRSCARSGPRAERRCLVRLSTRRGRNAMWRRAPRRRAAPSAPRARSWT